MRKADKEANTMTISVEEARALAKDTYIYGFPLVDNYRIQYAYFVDRNNPEYKASWNELQNVGRVYTPEDKEIQTPNSDTPYSMLGGDLRNEPLVLTIPKVEEGRYFALQFIDAYTYNFAYLGTRTSGNSGGRFLLAGPGWKGEKPASVESVIQSETDFVFVLYRTQLFNPDDIENVKKIQAGYKVQTLSAFLNRPAPSVQPAINFPKPLSADEERISLEFFNLLNFVLRFCPIHRSEKELRMRFAKLGIGAEQNFNAQELTPEVRSAVEDGIADAWMAYDRTEERMSTGELTSADVFGNRAYLKNHYLYRMLGAVDGIYGNSKEEALYPAYVIDAEGKPLNAANNSYSLRFAPGQLPPVNAFWSLTMYEMPSRMLVANPLNRYLINSPLLPNLQRDADGGLTLLIQHESPGKNKESNWLPAPNGPFFMALRLYWPKPGASDGTWTKPPLERMAVEELRRAG
jgi:hypothetical protein